MILSLSAAFRRTALSLPEYSNSPDIPPNFPASTWMRTHYRTRDHFCSFSGLVWAFWASLSNWPALTCNRAFFSRRGRAFWPECLNRLRDHNASPLCETTPYIRRPDNVRIMCTCQGAPLVNVLDNVGDRRRSSLYRSFHWQFSPQ